jgi:hypothetical protein
VKRTERWRERLRVVGLDARVVGQCQAAVAEAVEAFERIDVLLCAASEGMFCSTTMLRVSIEKRISCNRCRGRTSSKQSHYKFGGRDFRDQLLCQCQHHQSHFTCHARTEERPHHCHNRHK